MNNVYRLNVRFNLDDPEEREAAEYLQKLNSQYHKNMNRFIIQAICKAMKEEQARYDFSLDDIRDVFQDVIGRTILSPSDGRSSTIPDAPELSAVDREKMEASVLEDLDMFGC